MGCGCAISMMAVIIGRSGVCATRPFIMAFYLRRSVTLPLESGGLGRFQKLQGET